MFEDEFDKAKRLFLEGAFVKDDLETGVLVAIFDTKCPAPFSDLLGWKSTSWLRTRQDYKDDSSSMLAIFCPGNSVYYCMRCFPH